MSLIVSLSLKNNFWTVVIFIWFYHSLIMMDSGSLTAGTVEEGDATDRGALLAVHSMVGFGGGALGGPIVGYVLDYNGGSDFSVAWFYALLAMGMGSFFVFLIQFYFFKKNKINQ